MSKNKSRLIVALDIDSIKELRILLEYLEDYVDIFKVGSQLFTSCGPAAVRFIEARGKKVFLDLKYHDIPNTVASSVSAAVQLSVALERSMDFENRITPKAQGLFMYTVHTSGGLEMMQKAQEAGTAKAKELSLPKPLVVGVTVLTSEQTKENTQAVVLERALLAKKAGLDGIVASPHEAKMIRKEFGNDFIIVTPGIRPLGAGLQDQKRVATPKEAILSGSNFLVVGRPIIKAENPGKAAQEILKEMDF